MGSFSILHWLIVLVVIGGIGYAVVRSRKQATASLAVADGGTLKANVGPSGLGGWLILVVLGQIGGVLQMLKSIVDEVQLYEDFGPTVHYILNAEMALMVAYAILIVVTTISMFRTERRFVALWKIQAVITVLFPLIDAVIVSAVSNTPIEKLIDERAIGHVIGGTIGMGLWWWYMNVSVRVKNTFVK